MIDLDCQHGMGIRVSKHTFWSLAAKQLLEQRMPLGVIPHRGILRGLLLLFVLEISRFGTGSSGTLSFLAQRQG